MQQAIQAAVSQAFKTPEVIRMFAQKQPDQLRKRLATLKRELDLKHISKDAFNQQASEVLLALQKLGTELSEQEKTFLEQMSSTRLMESAQDRVGVGAKQNIISAAASQIKSAES